MSAPIMFEPTDPADTPTRTISAARFNKLATTLGASRIELGGGQAAVEYNGATYLLDGAA